MLAYPWGTETRPRTYFCKKYHFFSKAENLHHPNQCLCRPLLFLSIEKWIHRFMWHQWEILTHCGLWPSDTIWQQRSGSTLAQVMAWRHQAITWTNVDWSSVKSSDIHIRAISQEMPQPSITKICLNFTCLKFHSNFQGANVKGMCITMVTKQWTKV